MANKILEIQNLSKQYRLGVIGTGTLRDDINRFWAKIRGKEDPFLKIGDSNVRSTKGSSDYVWALRDITFDVLEGQVLGIVGKNGAGKSTLLKILSQITSPTTGHVKSFGRVAALLEVGTGFHPELTGRENIFLNGAIMGMNKAEIRSKLDEIIDFSGTERYIDTPVKRFSSGMRVRLGFAVAAHLEPEILIVDEVLAVGDAEFQKKAIGKMQDVSTKSGRTVLFVSHNMAAVKSLCDRAILLEDGIITYDGDTDETVLKYLKGDSQEMSHKIFPEKFNQHIAITELGARRVGHPPSHALIIDQDFEIFLKITIRKVLKFDCHVTLQIKDENGNYLFATGSEPFNFSGNGNLNFTCLIPKNLFNVGSYFVNLVIIENGKKPIITENDIISFILTDSKIKMGSWLGKSKGPFKPLLNWKIQSSD